MWWVKECETELLQPLLSLVGVKAQVDIHSFLIRPPIPFPPFLLLAFLLV